MQSDLHEARKSLSASALEPNLTLKLPEERGMTKPGCASHLLPTLSSEVGQGSTAWAPVGSRKERFVVRFGFLLSAQLVVLTG